MKITSPKKYYTATEKRYRKMQWQVLLTLLISFTAFVLFLLIK